jgi:hypothetical protein
VNCVELVREAWACMDCESGSPHRVGLVFRFQKPEALVCPNDPKHKAFENVTSQHEDCLKMMVKIGAYSFAEKLAP